MKKWPKCPWSFWTKHSGYGFAFPTYNASSKVTICVVTECLFIGMVSHTALFWFKELPSQQKKYGSWNSKNMLMEFTYNVPHFSEAAGLTECWRDYLLQHQIGGNTLQPGAKCCRRKAVHALNQPVWRSLSHSHNSWVQESRGGN